MLRSLPTPSLLPLLLLLLLLLLGRGVRCQSEEAHAHYHDTDGDGSADHDSAYDQDRFLGKERAKEFSDLSEKESIERLKKFIAEEVDLDKDGFVTMEELLKHLEKIGKKQLQSDLEKNWDAMNVTGDQLDWDTYARSLQPGVFEDSRKVVRDLAEKALEESRSEPKKLSIEIPAEVSAEDKLLLEELFLELVKHRRRWAAADANKDGLISKQEYWQLLFLDDYPSMREVLAQEMLENLDKDGDGRIAKSEYITDLWKPKAGEKQPEWLQEEANEFDKKKDINGDGFMDLDEIRKWLSVTATNTDKEEAEHLMQEADKDKDGRLSTDEVVAGHELFAGSQITNYGDDLESASARDEL